jgi:hypothetical protein
VPLEPVVEFDTVIPVVAVLVPVIVIAGALPVNPALLPLLPP